MQPSPPPTDQLCPIARSVAVLGQKWNLLLLREAFLGRTRYSEFQRLGVPPATLGARLDALVDAGRDVLPILAALIEWGETHLPLPSGDTIAYAMRSADGRPVRLEFVDDRQAVIDPDAVTVARRAR